MLIFESLFDLWYSKYLEVQISAEDDVPQRRLLELWYLQRKKLGSLFVSDQIDDVKVTDKTRSVRDSSESMESGKGKVFISVQVSGGGYRCELSIRPFMALALCHSWEIKFQLGL